jgi:hypothetical protein
MVENMKMEKKLLGEMDLVQLDVLLNIIYLIKTW